MLKVVSVDGFFIDPPKFIPNPKPQKQPVTPGKPVNQLDVSGIFIKQFSSIGELAREFKCDKKNMKDRIGKTLRPYKGYFFKYA